MRDRVLFRQFVCLQKRDGEPHLGRTETVRQWFVSLIIAETKDQRPRSEWHVGRHGRKAWLKDVAERRGLGVAGKRGRKAWLRGVFLRRAS